MSEIKQNVSEFYKRVEHAEVYLLAFPTNDYELPDWDCEGNLIEHDETEWTTTNVGAVNLEGNRYRLAEKLDFPFSECKLEWGEDFFADTGSENGNSLILRQVVMPEKYVHENVSCIMDPGKWRDSSESVLIHSLNGGWEYALGVLHISIPVDSYNTYREQLAIIDSDRPHYRGI